MADVGRPDWTTNVPSAELQAIHEYIDDEADYKSIDIFRNPLLNVARYTTPRSFCRYVKARRAQSRERIEDGVLSPSPPSRSELEAAARSALMRAMLLGKIPGYALPGVLAATTRMELAEFAAAAEQRAAAAFEIKMAEYRAEQARKLDALADDTPGLTPEIEAKIKRDLLGL